MITSTIHTNVLLPIRENHGFNRPQAAQFCDGSADTIRRWEKKGGCVSPNAPKNNHRLAVYGRNCPTTCLPITYIRHRRTSC